MFHSLYRRYGLSQVSSGGISQPEQAAAWPYPAPYAFKAQPFLPEAWQLSLVGLPASTSACAEMSSDVSDVPVETPSARSISLRQLLNDFPVVTQNRRWISASGWSIRADWQGVLLADVLRPVLEPLLKEDPQQKILDTLFLTQTSLGGQQETLPLKAALEHQALLCFACNGQSLPTLYGGPVALMVFHCLGYKGLPQLSRLQLSTLFAPGFWQQMGYALEGAIAAGPCYAMDLAELKNISTAGQEITAY